MLGIHIMYHSQINAWIIKNITINKLFLAMIGYNVLAAICTILLPFSIQHIF